MNTYRATVRFWIPACATVHVQAPSDAEVLPAARAAAAQVMRATGYPDYFDGDERRDGIIASLDRCTASAREVVAEDIEIHAELDSHVDGVGVVAATPHELLHLLHARGRAWLAAADAVVAGASVEGVVPVDLVAAENAAMLALKRSLAAALPALECLAVNHASPAPTVHALAPV